MKRCPDCNRTYADDSISFCLADGQLLSASYDDAATLPLSPSRVTDGRPRQIAPVQLSPEQACRRIRQFWIAGAIVAAAGFVFSQILFLTLPGNDKPGIAGRLAAGALSSLMYGYLGWSACWGLPAVWRWWRRITQPALQLISTRAQFNWLMILVILVLLAPALTLFSMYFYLPLIGGLAYGFLGGGIYQFLQARKIVRNSVSES